MRYASMISAALLAVGAPASATPEAIAALDWLAGAWVSEEGGRWTEEWWTHPRGGLIMGVGSGGTTDGFDTFEYMRVMDDEAGVATFYGSPGGASPVAFQLARSGKGLAVFESPRNDYPQRITYQLDGNELVATIELLDGTRKTSWRYKRKAP